VINYADKYCCSGWTVEILLYFSNKFSYDFELYFQAENIFGVYDNKTGEWNGVIQDVITGKGDLGTYLSIRPDRCYVLDCSSYLQDGFNVLLKLKKSEVISKGDERNEPLKLCFSYCLW
jgi:hypothetical protein